MRPKSKLNKSALSLFPFLFLQLISLGQSNSADTTMTVTRDEKNIILETRKKEIDLGKSRTTVLKCTVLNSNFTIPIIRFNTVQADGEDNNQKGNVSLFNSVGAGISINFGRMEITTDETGNPINTEMQNTIGFQLGVLFAANSDSGNNANVLAPTISFTILNFQLGCGYELGSISPKVNRFFYTLAYGIPLAKLIKGGFYVIRKGPPINPNSGFVN